MLKHSVPNNTDRVDDGLMRFKGLPLSACTKEEIIQFLSGLENVPNRIALYLEEALVCLSGVSWETDAPGVDRAQVNHSVQEQPGGSWVILWSTSEFHVCAGPWAP